MSVELFNKLPTHKFCNRQSTEYEIYYCIFLSIKKMWMDCAWLLAYYFISNQVNMRSKIVLKSHLGDITQLYM